jgi:hypothetical protein
MRLALAGLALVTALATTGCAPRLLPGTEIRDTPETHDIFEVLGSYRAALESRSVDGIMKLVSKGFFDDGGTPEGADDFDYAGLETRLKKWAENTKTLRATLDVRNILVEGETAKVQYFFDVNYQIPGPDGVALWKRESDTKEMALKREGSAWRIVSGI